jgi:hypothetical protein
METKIIAYILLMCLISNVEAQDIIFIIKDFNSRALVDNASITMNSTVFYSVNGLKSFDIGYNNSNYTVSKNDYFTENGIVNNIFCESNVCPVFLRPISQTGLIYVKFRDNSVLKHEICLFYRENNRLAGCFKENDTITLLNNHDYILIPQTGFTDNFNSLGSLKKGLPNITAIILPILFACFLFFILYAVLRGKR